MKRIGMIVFVAACMQQNPPPQYPQYQQQPQGQVPQQEAPPQPAVATQPAPPPEQPAPKPPEPPLPIAIDKDMPAQSLTTDATLVLGTEANVMLDSRSDIYSSTAKKADAGRGGVLPSKITLAAGGGIVTFPKVIGKAACLDEAGTDADGGDCAGGNTDILPAGSFSGIKHHERTMFLVGVFVGAKLPAKAPPSLDFSANALGTTFTKLEPVLGQVFYIGDGTPGTPPGGTHDFVIPKGATQLYLGYADAYAFQGTPGAYGDNKGGLSVTVLQRK